MRAIDAKRVFSSAILLCTLLVVRPAHAHAVLVDSTPKENEIVHGSSLHIDLKFNSRVDGPRCTVQLATADGTVKMLDMNAQMSPNEIVSHADGLTKGNYTLRWQALASDGHITRGQVAFQVE